MYLLRAGRRLGCTRFPYTTLFRSVRGQRSVGKATRLELLTPGVLLRRLMNDPELTGVSAVLLDEVKGRPLATDRLLGMPPGLARVRGGRRGGAGRGAGDAGAGAAGLGAAAGGRAP